MKHCEKNEGDVLSLHGIYGYLESCFGDKFRSVCLDSSKEITVTKRC